MATFRYLALLRGINVGGHNLIAKDDLRQCFERMGCTDVRTYIQSGNIVFRSEDRSIKRLSESVEDALSESFDYDAQAVVLSHRAYAAALESAPSDWGTREGWKHNAMFTLRETTPTKVLSQLPEPRPEIESVAVSPGVIFWSVDRDSQTRCTMMKVSAHAAYRQMTVRNHNTVFRLSQMLDEL